MVEGARALKPFTPARTCCCLSVSSSSDERDQTFNERWGLEKWRGPDIIVRLHNTKVHPRPPNLGLFPVVIDHGKVKVTPRKRYTIPKKERKYLQQLRRSWCETHILLHMDPNTPPPSFDTTYNQSKDDAYAQHALFSGVHYLQDATFLFIQPTQSIQDLQQLFPSISLPAFDIVDDAGRVKMFVAETLRMLHRTINPNTCFPLRKCRECASGLVPAIMAIDRNVQPWEASFLGADGTGWMHASRGNSHDVTITDYYNDLSYIIRTDTGRFPRHYNIVDAKTTTILCQLGLPLPPDDQVLGNFDIFMEGQRIGKIRQGAWRFGMGYDSNPFRMRHGVHLHPNVHPELKAFIVVALINAHFTYNVLKEPEDHIHSLVEKCNPDIWQSVFPVPNIDDPYDHDQYYLNHALFFYHPWYNQPESTRQLSSTSTEIVAEDFFSRYLEDRIDFTYEAAKRNQVGLPYYKPMPNTERMARNLYWVTSNQVKVLDQGYSYLPVPFHPAEVKEIINRKKKHFQRREDKSRKLNEVSPSSKTQA